MFWNKRKEKVKRKGFKLMKNSTGLGFFLVVFALFMIVMAQRATFPLIGVGFGIVMALSSISFLVSALRSMQLKAVMAAGFQAVFFIASIGFNYITVSHISDVFYKTASGLALGVVLLSGFNIAMTLTGKNAIVDDGIFDESYTNQKKQTYQTGDQFEFEEVKQNKFFN